MRHKLLNSHNYQLNSLMKNFLAKFSPGHLLSLQIGRYLKTDILLEHICKEKRKSGEGCFKISC